MTDSIQNSLAFEQTLRQYSGLIYSISSSFPEHYREDLRQEGIIGLYAACRTFSEESGLPFRSYAAICIRRRMLTSYKQLKRGDTVVSLDEVGDGWASSESLQDDIVNEHYAKEIIALAENDFSELEKKVLGEYLREKTPAEISESLGISEKSAENAMTRVKNKLKAHICNN